MRDIFWTGTLASSSLTVPLLLRPMVLMTEITVICDILLVIVNASYRRKVEFKYKMLEMIQSTGDNIINNHSNVVLPLK